MNQDPLVVKFGKGISFYSNNNNRVMCHMFGEHGATNNGGFGRNEYESIIL